MNRHNPRQNQIMRLISKSLSVIMIMIMILICTADPQHVEAAGSDKLPNAVMLDMLRSDRSFVVDALTIGVRPEADWGGDAFDENPHFMELHDHYMYETLAEEIEADPLFAGMIELYKAKINWEEYPLETLMSAATSSTTSPFMGFIKQLNSQFNEEAVKALKQAYEDMGGDYPVNIALNQISEEADTDAYRDFWNGYSLVRLRNLQGKDGTTAYDDYKDSIHDSEDEHDQRVYDILLNAESYCAQKKVNDGDIKITSQLLSIVQSKISFDQSVDGNTIKSAKIYDAVLSDIFSTDYTSGAGVSLGRDLASKETFELYTNIFKNNSKMVSFVKNTAELTD